MTKMTIGKKILLLIGTLQVLRAFGNEERPGGTKLTGRLEDVRSQSTYPLEYETILSRDYLAVIATNPTTVPSETVESNGAVSSTESSIDNYSGSTESAEYGNTIPLSTHSIVTDATTVYPVVETPAVYSTTEEVTEENEAKSFYNIHDTVGRISEPDQQDACEGRPDSVYNLSANVFAESILLTWEHLTSSDGCVKLYNITWYSESKDFEFRYINSTESEYNVSNLTPCTTFNIGVVAIGINGYNSEERGVTVTTGELPIPPIDNLTVQSFEYGLNVSWDPPETVYCLASYRVSVQAVDEAFETSVDVSRRVTMHAFDNLRACTNYTVKVVPISSEDTDGTVATANGETSISAIPQVNNLNVLSIDCAPSINCELIVTWEPPDETECLDSYLVTAGTVDDTSLLVSRTVSDETKSYKFTDLMACTTYVIQVTPIGRDDNHGIVATVNGTTKDSGVLGAVTDLVAQEITSSSVRVTWSAPTLNLACVKNYYVTVCSDITCDKNFVESLYYNATGLNPCVTYTLSVTALGVVGISDVRTTSAETSDLTPGAPTIVSVRPGQYSLHISWQAPSVGRTCIQSYRVVTWQTGATRTTKNTNITISNLNACAYYEIGITPISITNREGQFGVAKGTIEESVEIPPTPNVEPSVTVNSITLSWRITRQMNACRLKTILTTCDFVSTHGHGFEMVSGRSEVDIPSSGNSIVNVTVGGLSPFTSYNCQGFTENYAGYSRASDNVSARTSEDVPSRPTPFVSDVQSSTFLINWTEPRYLAGYLIEYELYVLWQRQFPMPGLCEYTNSSVTISNISGSDLRYFYSGAEAYSKYTVRIRARTNAGWGDYGYYTNFQTDPDVPGVVNNVSYINTTNANDSNVLDTLLSWELPCKLNGKIENFVVSVNGTRNGFENHVFNEIYNVSADVNNDERFTLNLGELRAEYNYTFEIAAKVEGISAYGPSSSCNVIYPAGIPVAPADWYMAKIKIDPHKAERSSSTALVVLPLFEDTNGEIQFYAVTISEMGYNSPAESRFDTTGGNWPSMISWQEAMSRSPIVTYQATAIRWHPNATNHIYDYGTLKAVRIMLGEDITCPRSSTSNSETVYCNGPLRPDTWYQVRMRAFTNGGYRDSLAIVAKTEAEFNLGVTIGVVFGILFLGVITTMMLLVRRGVIQAIVRNFLHPSVPSSPVPDPFTRKKFELHCQELISNPGKLNNEFQLLHTLSVDLQMSTNAASLQANKKKNRYMDILPYDISRVKLDILDNDPNTDYINASFINGYSGAVEYIACQGPKEETTSDFWRMVFQYNIKIIVMVTQLVEKGKEKCYQYYPNTRESFEYEDMTIRCSTQLDFESYRQRIITLQKGTVRRTIMHLHFKDWSDHGVPDDVHSMIHFCQKVRKQIDGNRGIAVVHCSAGVGRTGTLIAIDILLQQIRDNKKLDVFGTVYRLRQHRVNMVQTESQYAYIYNCTKQALSNPYAFKNFKSASVDPIYENQIRKEKEITDSNTNLVNSAETLKKVSPSSSIDSMEQIFEIRPQRPILETRLSSTSNGLRYTKSTGAIDRSVSPGVQMVRYGSHEYPIFEPAPDSPGSRGSMERNSLLDLTRPTFEIGAPYPSSINQDDNIGYLYRARPKY
ncbi:receptor-type tyrosine-protein phosphatase eta isoform X2 [Athalia rosae]|uniref:receptor-type tyrosine-protein phosphatase eta isoform X2 n=1 Tax=Athalia rosae TaxID=37344 RepID=UPI002033C605|nr:receptor-type tyrosine-protein phosphatase eta isoform X2 [Athalia rosae]